MVEMGEARVDGPAVGEVQATGQIHVALHPESVQCVILAALGLDGR